MCFLNIELQFPMFLVAANLQSMMQILLISIAITLFNFNCKKDLSKQYDAVLLFLDRHFLEVKLIYIFEAFLPLLSILYWMQFIFNLQLVIPDHNKIKNKL